MSQLLQGHHTSVDDGTGVPDLFWNGIPHLTNGALAIDSVSAITLHHQGLPFTANGRIAVQSAVPANFNNGAMPLTANGKLARNAAGPAINFLAANGYRTDGQLFF